MITQSNQHRAHFLLFAGARPTDSADEGGTWQFLLESLDRSVRLEAADREPHVDVDRLDLLALVRGLEALDQPSRVTLLTESRYLSHGLRFGLPGWRESGWRWEQFGRLEPIRHADLWRRVDRALQFHRVTCRYWPRTETDPVDEEPAMQRGLRHCLQTLAAWLEPLRRPKTRMTGPLVERMAV